VFADSVITESKIFIVSLDNLFGVLIESVDLSRTFPECPAGRCGI